MFSSLWVQTMQVDLDIGRAVGRWVEWGDEQVSESRWVGGWLVG